MIILLFLATKNIEPPQVQLPDLGGGAPEQLAQSMIGYIGCVELRTHLRSELHLDHGVQQVVHQKDRCREVCLLELQNEEDVHLEAQQQRPHFLERHAKGDRGDNRH